MYRVILSACGNIDHDEDPYSNIVDGFRIPSETVQANSIRECQDLVLNYIDTYNLGGGNWTGGDVFENDRNIGYISYNGKFWSKVE